MISGLDHVNIETCRLDQTIRFYEDILGFVNGERPPFDFPGAWLYASGHPVIHLVEVSSSASSKGPIDHVAWIASGYEALREKLRKGGQYFEEREVPKSIVRQIFLKDPNGVKLELNFNEE